MYVSTNYTISLKGPKEEIEKISAWVLTLFDDEAEISEDGVIISDTRKIWWVPEITDLAREIVKRSPNISAFTIKGTVDNSVCKDFLITYENGSLFVQDSDWYLIMAPDEDDDYEEFCGIYGDYSEEDFEKFKKCPHYILNEGHGEVVSSVPLCAPELVVGKKRIKPAGDTPHEDDFTTLTTEKASDIINHPALWNDLASYLNGEWLHNNSKTVAAFAVAYIRLRILKTCLLKNFMISFMTNILFGNLRKRTIWQIQESICGDMLKRIDCRSLQTFSIDYSL